MDDDPMMVELERLVSVAEARELAESRERLAELRGEARRVLAEMKRLRPGWESPGWWLDAARPRWSEGPRL